MATRTRWLLLGGMFVLLVLVGVTRVICMSVWWQTGIVIKGCPDGKLRQVVDVRATLLKRKDVGDVTIGVRAHFTRAHTDIEDSVPVRKFDAAVALVDAAGKETPLAVKRAWTQAGDERSAGVELPDVPDGDYKLRAKIHTKIGDETVDVPLALYAPARVHVITDRPLYEPGNTIRFRAVVLRARDLAPLDGRPGLWVVKDPSGEVLLEEKAPAGPWGVIAGSFPIDSGAATGEWRVSWTSAGASDEVAVRVEPFTLPRFRVEAQPQKPYYRAGERPVVTGAAVYSSGAPVAGAAVEITWEVQGEWPPPTEWLGAGGLLPGRATTSASGTYKLELPPVPADLQGQVRLVARVGVTDAAGDRVDGGAAVLLTEDGIMVSAVTELEGGLVEGFNNRVYLRVTTPDGRALEGAKIHVRRAWSEKDKGEDAVLDEDGVASLQLDPGPAVNVVIPAQPYRPPAPRKVVARGGTRDAFGQGATLDDQLAMDGWLKDLEPCALLTDGGEAVTLALAVEESGALASVAAPSSPMGACVAGKLAGKRLPAGNPRLLHVAWSFQDPDVPRLDVSLNDVMDSPGPLSELVAQAARAARGCLPATSTEGPLPRALIIRARAGKKELELRWMRDPQANAPSTAGAACVEGRIKALALASEAGNDGMALARFSVVLPERMQGQKPQPTIMQGYELLVSAAVDGAPKTKLRLGPGSVPPLRLRATPVLAQPGDTINLELIRGPGFSGSVPTEITLDHLRGHLTAKVDKETRKASLVLDKEAQGWCEVTAGGARALVFVRPRGELSVAVKPAKDRYAPGQTAELAIETKSGDHGAPAAVGLFGVDQSLEQLAPLPGPDDMGRVRPQVTMSAPAFGVLEAQALALGRVRGANAAAATVLRVTAIPSAPELDVVTGGSGATPFDPAAVATDSFYNVLAELQMQTRRWETEAPAAEKMKPQTMAQLWKKAVAACAKRGEATEDAYGRALRLSRLPADLLALTDPRAVVAQGTRLPEDVESWSEYVARVKP